MEAFNLRDWFIGAPVTPFAGDAKTGCAGGAVIVVKFHAAGQALVPPALAALTLQKYWVLLFKPETAYEVSLILL